MVSKFTRPYVPKVRKPLRTKIKMNDEIVSQYLSDHPDFFIRHAAQIEHMKIPHPVRGGVSLPEWKMARQRHKINQLETEMTLLMEHASANEKLFNQFIQLQTQLLKTTNLIELDSALNCWAKSLGLQGAYLYLFDDKWHLDAPLNYHRFKLNASRFDFIRVRHLQYSHQYLGPLNSTELDLLLPERCQVGSVALSLLGEFGDLGLLMFTSRYPNHYQPGQGTFLIEKISEMLPIMINKWIMRKNKEQQ